MTICDVCESRNPTTPCKTVMTTGGLTGAAKEAVFDLCDQCLEYFWAGPFLSGMKSLRKECLAAKEPRAAPSRPMVREVKR